MKPETVIKLNRFKPRPYQLPLISAFEHKKYKRLLAIWPRRAGKDVVAFNLMLRAALRKIGVYYYIFPTYSQARKVIWDSITNEGQRFLDYIPSELIDRQNNQEMKVFLINGSLIQMIGSDNIDAIVGTNPQGIVFSEYALQDPSAYHFLRPILLANDGWALFISTVRGRNHLYEMYNIASHNEEWFVEKLSVINTAHISLHEIEKEKAEGIMSEDLIQQEYYNDFNLGIEGSYYAKYIQDMRIKGQLGIVPHEPNFPVHTAWDLGMDDSTIIIFFQITGQIVRIVDFYEHAGVGFSHYVNILQNKGYNYGKHFAPHDIAVRELGTGLSRLERARQLGIKFITAPNLPIYDGIEAVRASMSKIWIDEQKCAPLIKALEHYRKVWNKNRGKYDEVPFHDKYSHAADALRYLCLCLPRTKKGMTEEDAQRLRAEALYGPGSNIPAVFRKPNH